MDRGQTSGYNEGKVRILLRENRIAAERKQMERKRAVQRQRRETSIVAAPRINQNHSDDGEANVPWSSNSPPVPAVARRLKIEQRRKKEVASSRDSNPRGNNPPLSQASFNEEATVIAIPLNSISSRRNAEQYEIQIEEYIPARVATMMVSAEEHNHKWSLFQVWNNLAYATCSVPYRIVWAKQYNKFVMNHNRLQQCIYGAQTTAALFEMTSWWRQFISIINGSSNPLKYVKIIGLVSKCMVQLCEVKTTMFGLKDVLRLHNLILEHDSIIHAHLQLQMTKGNTIVALTGYSIYLVSYCIIKVTIKTFVDQQDWEWGLAELIQSFACYTRVAYLFTNSSDCPNYILWLTQIPLKEYLLGGTGLFIFMSRVLLDIHCALQIMTSCLTLMNMSRYIRKMSICGNTENTDSKTTERPSIRSSFHIVEQSTDTISSYIGLVLLLKLIVIACEIPKCLDELFNAHSIKVIPTVIDIFMLLLAFLVACIFALQIQETQGEIVEPQNADELPNDVRRLFLYLLRVFRKSVGIGYRNLFVLNFPFMFMYFSSIAGLVCFTYETEQNK